MLNVIDLPNLSPEIFTIDIGFMSFTLRWYALAYIIGLLSAWQIIVRMIKQPDLWKNNIAPMKKDNPEQLLTWMIFGVIIGGRLGFVLFYQANYYLHNPLEIPMVWKGGMSFHGGFIGVSISGIIFCHKNKLSILSVGDLIAVTTPIGIFLGRIANFINGELFGKPSNLPWAVIFPNQNNQDCGMNFVEICSRHPSQLYEALFEGLFLGLLLFWGAFFKSWLKLPGLSVGIFFTGYGASRCFIEIFRQPDNYYVTVSNPFGYMIQISDWGLSSGQVLSIPMIVIGIIIISKIVMLK